MRTETLWKVSVSSHCSPLVGLSHACHLGTTKVMVITLDKIGGCERRAEGENLKV